MGLGHSFKTSPHPGRPSAAPQLREDPLAGGQAQAPWHRLFLGHAVPCLDTLTCSSLPNQLLRSLWVTTRPLHCLDLL